MRLPWPLRPRFKGGSTMRQKQVTGLALLFATICAVATARAALITIDFNSAAPCLICLVPYDEDGFQLTPISGHYDIVPTPTPPAFGIAPSLDGTNWMGIDSNVVAPPVMRLDHAGASFTLRELDAHWESHLHVRSSNGGEFNPPFPPGAPSATFAFAGPAWTSVAWIEFYTVMDPGLPFGFDNILLEIPEPSSLALVALAMITLTFALRRSSNTFALRRKSK